MSRWSSAARPTCTSRSARSRSSACTGSLERLEGFGRLTPDDTQRLLYRILSTEQQKHLEIKRQLDFSYSIPGLARFRVNVYFQRESLGAAFRIIPTELKTLEELGMPQALARARARSRAASSSSPARPARASRRRSPR